MAKKIRCAVLGLGRLGYWHALNASTRIRNAEVVKICDVDRTKAEKVAKELEIPHYTSNPDDIFNDDTIDAVIIATSTSTHFELLKQASKSKKSIFVEKPLTFDVNESEEVCKLINENKNFCQVGFMRRFDPAYAEAKRRIDAGDIGQPIYFKGISRDPDAPPAEYVKYSGGIITDVSIHDFDIARFLMKSEVTTVSAHGKVIKYPYVADYQDVDQALTYMEFASGAIGDVEASRNAYYGYDIRAEIIGTEGTILVGNNLSYHNINILTKSNFAHDILPHFPERFADAYYLELAEFFSAVEEGRDSKVTAKDGLKALEIAVAARESLIKQKTVNL